MISFTITIVFSQSYLIQKKKKKCSDHFIHFLRILFQLKVKQRCEVLEDQLVDLVVMAMERSENEDSSAENGMNQLLWQHLSSQVIYFVLFQFASFPHMVMSLYEKVKKKNIQFTYNLKLLNTCLSIVGIPLLITRQYSPLITCGSVGM